MALPLKLKETNDSVYSLLRYADRASLLDGVHLFNMHTVKNTISILKADVYSFYSFPPTETH